MRQLIEDLISMMEYHVEQTRPIHSTTVALQAAREALKSLPPQRTEPIQSLQCFHCQVTIETLNDKAMQLMAQRKPLTEEQIWKAIRPLATTDQLCKKLIDISMDEYRAIEAAHGIKEDT